MNGGYKMGYVGLMLLIVLLAYLTTSYSAYREIEEKKLSIKFNFSNVIFFLIIPLSVSIIHLKMANRFYKEGKKKEAKLLLELAIIKPSSGIAVFLEFMIHSAIVDAVYGKSKSKVKVKRESKKITSEALNWGNLKGLVQNPFNYGNTVFVAA